MMHIYYTLIFVSKKGYIKFRNMSSDDYAEFDNYDTRISEGVISRVDTTFRSSLRELKDYNLIKSEKNCEYREGT